jgi:hypothetical protein
MEDREAQNRAEEQPAPPSRLPQFLQRRFASRKRAAWTLLGTIAGFHVVAWLFLEASGQVRYSCHSLVSRLGAAPGEIMAQALLAPFFMSYAIPALPYQGNLFHWDPGWFTRRFSRSSIGRFWRPQSPRFSGAAVSSGGCWWCSSCWPLRHGLGGWSWWHCS